MNAMKLLGKRTTVIFVVAIFLVIATIFFLFKREKGNMLPPVPLHELPNLVFKNYEGQEVNLAAIRGRPLVINTWASWCPFCVAELPRLAALQKQYGDRILILEVNRGESAEIAKKYTEQSSFAKDLDFVLDPSDSLYTAIGGFSMPETIFVSKDGLILYHKRGPMDLLEMQRRVQDIFGL